MFMPEKSISCIILYLVPWNDTSMVLSIFLKYTSENEYKYSFCFLLCRRYYG